MKPDNTREPIFLEDGAGVRCQFVFGREDCEQWATEEFLNPPDKELKREYPKSPIWLRSRNDRVWLCDTHITTLREMHLDI